MSRMRASSWESEAFDPAWDASEPLRAKIAVRRTPARWEERESALHAAIGRWLVRVASMPNAPSRWEWSAFSQGAPRALRCTGFGDAASAQRDAESTLSRVE